MTDADAARLPWYIRFLVKIPNDRVRVWGYYILRLIPIRIHVILLRLRFHLSYFVYRFNRGF